MKILVSILMFSVLLISCGDDSITVNDKNCSNACNNEWQVCNEETQKCEPKDGRCDNDEVCKDQADTPVCNLVTHLCVADGCSDKPCDANTENGNTLCSLDDSELGYSCICQDGFEFDENDKCIETVVDPCEENPCANNTDGLTVCKADASAESGYICEAPVTDACTDEPCKDNTEGKTVCVIDDNSTDGYICEAPIVLDPCEGNPCANNTDGLTVCKADESAENGYICEAPATDACTDEPCKDNANGQTNCLLAENVDGYVCSCEDGFELNNGGVCEQIQCDNTCEEFGSTKCIGDRLVECVKDDTTYCTVWEDTTDAEDCGAGLCTDNNDGAAYCSCQECDPATFNSVCSEDVSSYEYCKEENGCFSIETVNCGAGEHCAADADASLSCVTNTCTDDPACTSEDFLKCATTGGASILQGCQVNEEGCLVLYTVDNCDSKNMECDVYNNVAQCLGGDGSDTCENSANNDNEILASGVWFGTTSDKNDDYQGCDNDMDGNDVVYSINIQQGENLTLSLAEFDSSSFSTIKPTIYILKGNCNNNNNCFKGETNDDDTATISLTNMDAGYYNIIVDRNPGNIDFTNGYDFVLTVDLQQ